jgi:hypothetical protein
MRRRVLLALFAILTVSLTASSILPGSVSSSGTPPVSAQASCPITPPNTGPTPYGGQVPPVVGWYANDSLWVGLTGYEPWRVGDNKVAWWRKIPGILVIECRRLDAPAPPLKADASGYYGLFGFQPSGITFPSAGCYEVVGYLVTVRAGTPARIGDELRFVIRVEW